MSFLNPAFFWALLAISIPIIIHLINFRRHKTLYFSNTRLLQNLKKETKNKSQLKQLLILLSRILTIVMLVFVFAGPFIPFDKDRASDRVGVTGIYIDNSFSMQAESREGQLLELAKQTGLEIINSTDSDMKFMIVTNDMKPEHQVLLNHENAIREIEQIEISPLQINLNELVLKTNTVIPENKVSNVYILTDLQEHFVGNPTTELNENISLFFMPLTGAIVNNILIDTCYFETPVHRYGQQEKLIVRVKSFSDEDNYDVPLQLYINDSLKAFSGVNIEANETKNVELNYVNTEKGAIFAKVQITDYPIVYDNDLYFNYFISDKVRILMINGRDNNRFIESLYKSDEDNFDLTQVQQGSEQTMNFGSYDLIILNEISDISTGLGEGIKSFVEDGGSVAFIPANELNHTSCNAFLERFNAGRFIPGEVNSGEIRSLDYKHEIFRNVFQRSDNQVDLPKINIMHSFAPNVSAAPANIISADRQSPVLTSFDRFNGSLYVFAIPLNNDNSQFLRHPLFVPVLYNMAINSQLNNPLYTVFEPEAEYEIISFDRFDENNLIKITDDNELEIIPNFRYTGRSLSVFIPEELNQAGNYKIQNNGDFISGLSINYNRKESYTNFLSLDELQVITDGLYGDKSIIVDDPKDGFQSAIDHIGVGKMLWKLFLLMAIFFIICEVLIIRFLR